MSSLKMMNTAGKYKDPHAKEDVIDYIRNPEKTRFQGGAHVNMSCPAEDMHRVSEQFGKLGHTQLRHYIVSYSPEETKDPAVVNKIAQEIADYVGKNYQAVYAVHEGTNNLHIHLVSNTISYVDGHRHLGRYDEINREKRAIRKIQTKYGIHSLKCVSGKAYS